MNIYKEGDIVVVNCECRQCYLSNWIGTVVKDKEFFYAEFTEIWYSRSDNLMARLDGRSISIRFATKQEKIMYLIYGSRALEK